MSSINIKTNEFTLASLLVLVGSPLLLSGQFLIGGLCILLALAVKASDSTSEPKVHHLPFHNLTPKDLVAKLNAILENFDGGNTDEDIRIRRVVEGLAVLGLKYDKAIDKEELSHLYQELSFRVLRLYPEDDKVVAGSISLLALVAKNPKVRERFIHNADDYGLNCPIGVLKKVLQRAGKEEEEMKEEALAEILRKGCLFLGAICSDGEDLGLPSIIVSEGGLELILETANWFRMHEDVCNWALWAIFTLCYDNLAIKGELVRSQGIQIISRLMENNPTSLEVNRHGTALFFDLLRENHQENQSAWNSWEIKKIAIKFGLHDRILSAMTEFSDSMDIIMMGREILLGTGYRGLIPEYKPI